jgi:hypothetical protein
MTTNDTTQVARGFYERLSAGDAQGAVALIADERPRTGRHRSANQSSSHLPFHRRGHIYRRGIYGRICEDRCELDAVPATWGRGGSASTHPDTQCELRPAARLPAWGHTPQTTSCPQRVIAGTAAGGAAVSCFRACGHQADDRDGTRCTSARERIFAPWRNGQPTLVASSTRPIHRLRVSHVLAPTHRSATRSCTGTSVTARQLLRPGSVDSQGQRTDALAPATPPLRAEVHTPGHTASRYIRRRREAACGIDGASVGSAGARA